MTTNIWLKSQPNKKISYPDCWPKFNDNNGTAILQGVYIKDNLGVIVASYSIEHLSRVEFRP